MVQKGLRESRFARVYVWSGAVAFALSLAYFLYFYVVVLERPRPAPHPARSLAVNIALFSLFAAHHSVMARTGAKAWIVGLLPPSLERSTYVWLSSVLFTIVCIAWQPLPGTLYALPGAARLVGWAIQTAGVLLIAHSVAVLAPLEFAGVSPVEPTARRPGSEPPPLSVVGPYHFVRHPLYLGWMLFVFGSPVMTSGRFAFAVISTVYLLLAIPWEEDSLIEEFGTAYRQYRERVPWRLVPFIY